VSRRGELSTKMPFSSQLVDPPLPSIEEPSLSAGIACRLIIARRVEGVDKASLYREACLLIRLGVNQKTIRPVSMKTALLVMI
jgi:hypothetical protein